MCHFIFEIPLLVAKNWNFILRIIIFEKNSFIKFRISFIVIKTFLHYLWVILKLIIQIFESTVTNNFVCMWLCVCISINLSWFNYYFIFILITVFLFNSFVLNALLDIFFSRYPHIRFVSLLLSLALTHTLYKGELFWWVVWFVIHHTNGSISWRC